MARQAKTLFKSQWDWLTYISERCKVQGARHRVQTHKKVQTNIIYSFWLFNSLTFRLFWVFSVDQCRYAVFLDSWFYLFNWFRLIKLIRPIKQTEPILLTEINYPCEITDLWACSNFPQWSCRGVCKGAGWFRWISLWYPVSARAGLRGASLLFGFYLPPLRAGG
jgi:hypothetical protein